VRYILTFDKYCRLFTEFPNSIVLKALTNTENVNQFEQVPSNIPFLTNATCRLACDNGPLPLDDAFANIIGKMYSIDLFNVAISEHILDAAVHNKDLNLFTLQYCKVTPDLGRVFEGHPTLNFLEWVSLSPPCSKF